MVAGRPSLFRKQPLEAVNADSQRQNTAAPGVNSRDRLFASPGVDCRLLKNGDQKSSPDRGIQLYANQVAF
jgi:hypothetical protein